MNDAAKTKSAVVQSKTRWLESWAPEYFGRPIEEGGAWLCWRRRVGLNPSQPYLRKSAALQIGASTDSAAVNKLTAFISTIANGQVERRSLFDYSVMMLAACLRCRFAALDSQDLYSSEIRPVQCTATSS
jgi:hypothetical protein